MIGSDVILFPDTGPDFTRTLRTALLYSQRVYVLTSFALVPSKEIEVSYVQSGTGPYKTALAERLLQYFSFVRDMQQDLSMLEAEGVLSSLASPAHEIIRSTAEDVLKNLNKEAFAKVESLVAPLLNMPPSFADIHTHLHMLQRLVSDEAVCMPLDKLAAWEKDLFLRQDVILRFYTFVYFAMLNVAAEQRGAALLSWSSDYQDALRLYRDLLTSKGCPTVPQLAARRLGEARLGQVVVRRHLPLVDDLPFQELLELRRTRSDELEAFRIALAELSTHIDLTECAPDLDVQIYDLVVKRVDPALRDVRNALRTTRLNALAKLGESPKVIATGTVAAALSFAAGAPLDLTAVVAALGATASTLLDYSIERRKLLHASQWSILLNFETANSKQKRRVTRR